MAGRRPANPPGQERGFVRIDSVRCPDCEYNERLRNDGGAKVIGGGQLRGATKDVGVTRASSGCPTCKGRGRIPTSDLEALMQAGIEDAATAHLDPYSRALKPSAALVRKPPRPTRPVH